MFEHVGNDTWKVTRQSPFSKKTNIIFIRATAEQVAEYCSGEGYIQEIFSKLSADEREFIISGITPSEWKETFGDET
jgi:hypothetical protein